MPAIGSHFRRLQISSADALTLLPFFRPAPAGLGIPAVNFTLIARYAAAFRGIPALFYRNSTVNVCNPR